MFVKKSGMKLSYMKDKTGRVIGFEKLNLSAVKPTHLKVAFETITA